MDLSFPHSNASILKVAILVDGDNFPQADVGAVEGTAAAIGKVAVRRVFGDMALRKDWASQSTFTAMHCPTNAGKNRADMALVVAAMDLAHRGLASAFMILSDDRDFGPLVSHLRECGYRVEWIGKPKPVVAKPKAGAGLTDVDKRLVDAIRREGGASDGVLLQKLGVLMKGATVKEQTGKTSWRSHLKSKPDLFVVDGDGLATRVRLKP